MPFLRYRDSIAIFIWSIVHPPWGLQSRLDTDELRPKGAYVPKKGTVGAHLYPQNLPTSLQTSMSLSVSFPFPSHLTIFYIILTLLYFLLSLPTILTIVLGIGLGATVPSDWTQAKKILLAAFFYLTAALLWGLTFWSYICPPLISHCSTTTYRVLC
jgi:hypothetical protein